MLTRKYYKAIADGIHNAKVSAFNATENNEEVEGVHLAFSFFVTKLVDIFIEDNPNFNAELFRDACK